MTEATHHRDPADELESHRELTADRMMAAQDFSHEDAG
jgi:hypothetical protein